MHTLENKPAAEAARSRLPRWLWRALWTAAAFFAVAGLTRLGVELISRSRLQAQVSAELSAHGVYRPRVELSHGFGARPGAELLREGAALDREGGNWIDRSARWGESVEYVLLTGAEQVAARRVLVVTAPPQVQRASSTLAAAAEVLPWDEIMNQRDAWTEVAEPAWLSDRLDRVLRGRAAEELPEKLAAAAGLPNGLERFMREHEPAWDAFRSAYVELRRSSLEGWALAAASLYNAAPESLRPHAASAAVTALQRFDLPPLDNLPHAVEGYRVLTGMLDSAPEDLPGAARDALEALRKQYNFTAADYRSTASLPELAQAAALTAGAAYLEPLRLGLQTELSCRIRNKAECVSGSRDITEHERDMNIGRCVEYLKWLPREFAWDGLVRWHACEAALSRLKQHLAGTPDFGACRQLAWHWRSVLPANTADRLDALEREWSGVGGDRWLPVLDGAGPVPGEHLTLPDLESVRGESWRLLFTALEHLQQISGCKTETAADRTRVSDRHQPRETQN